MLEIDILVQMEVSDRAREYHREYHPLLSCSNLHQIRKTSWEKNSGAQELLT